MLLGSAPTLGKTSERRVICFDLGGVLVNICRSWAEACERCGIAVKNAELLASEASRARRSLVVDRYQRGELESGAYYTMLSSALDDLYRPAEVERVHRSWLRGQYPGATELVKQLNELPGTRTACLSNTNAIHWLLLQHEEDYPALAALNYRFASHQLGCIKPDARIYAMVEQQLEAAPSDIFFFDDLEENVSAARQRGWHSERIDPLRDPVRQVRDALGLSDVS